MQAHLGGPLPATYAGAEQKLPQEDLAPVLGWSNSLLTKSLLRDHPTA